MSNKSMGLISDLVKSFRELRTYMKCFNELDFEVGCRVAQVVLLLGLLLTRFHFTVTYDEGMTQINLKSGFLIFDDPRAEAEQDGKYYLPRSFYEKLNRLCISFLVLTCTGVIYDYLILTSSSIPLFLVWLAIHLSTLVCNIWINILTFQASRLDPTTYMAHERLKFTHAIIIVLTIFGLNIASDIESILIIVKYFKGKNLSNVDEPVRNETVL
ncbi:hypothetical protein RF11_10572 [Thelohanellus kitauei]|uniref:Uncharacterized protein n=1 Tax=Thelohanellus kitauei TaxID=669202 RepID=A0A0C2NKH0_THEKT|nr:hypothetical protein RF11_10572 [Thelohanellus kitauei]